MPRAILSDLDRTLTGPDLVPDPRVTGRIEALADAGVRVVVISGRVLPHLLALPYVKRLAGLVAENGAVLAVPPDQPARPCDAAFAARARAALGPLAGRFLWGDVLASGPRELEPEARALLEAAGVACLSSFNAEEVMLLPAGVDKAAGALRALEALGIAPRDALAVGDGENDAPLLAAVGEGVAVANAHPIAKAAAVRVTRGAYSDGFLELADTVLAEAR